MSEQGQFIEPTWAIVELMGRNVIAGQISEVAVAGAAMLRVDVPATNDVDAYTKFVGGQAIYAITPTDEASARHAAQHFQQAPVSRWVIPYRELPASVEEQGDPDIRWEDLDPQDEEELEPWEEEEIDF